VPVDLPALAVIRAEQVAANAITVRDRATKASYIAHPFGNPDSILGE
jgi:hypothetical protein